MVAMGLIQGYRPDLGVECGGVVHRLGKKVRNFAKGDRVMTFHHGCFSSSFATSENQVVKIPDTLSFEEAATMPCVYTTVIHSLINIGQLDKSQVSRTKMSCVLLAWN